MTLVWTFSCWLFSSQMFTCACLRDLLISQVQNLTLRSQKLGVLSSSQNGPPKSSSQTQSLSLCANKPVTSTKGIQPESSDSNRKGDSPAPECRSAPVTRTSSIHQLITPGRLRANYRTEVVWMLWLCLSLMLSVQVLLVFCSHSTNAT